MHVPPPKPSLANPCAEASTPLASPLSSWLAFQPETGASDSAGRALSREAMGLSQAVPLAIMDSGVGGLAVAQAVRHLAPQWPLVYLADTAWMPYGDKSLDDLKLRVRQLYQGLQRTFGTQHLVLACNSASASLPLPATLPALGVADDAMANQTTTGLLPPLVDIISTTVTHATAWAHTFVATHGRPPRLALVATVATHRSHRYEDWMGYAEAPCQLASFACPGLASAIEHQAPNLGSVLAYALAPVQRWQPDALILGCTHYLLVAPLFAQVLGDDVPLINPAGVIAKRLVSGLPTLEPHVEEGHAPPTLLLTTGDLTTATQILNPWVERCRLK